MSADGVASPVYDHDTPEKPVPTSTAPAANAATSRLAPVQNTSAEWDELRERLRQQANPKPARKSLLGL